MINLEESQAVLQKHQSSSQKRRENIMNQKLASMDNNMKG